MFSNYSIPKRKKREKTRSSPKLRLKYDHSDVSVESIEKLEDSEDDEELLDLRLQALKSKQEVKELIDEESTQIQISPSEEEHLRIAALKSAVLKKKEFFKERKKQKMLENERPYSPSDALPELQIDMSLSPLGSPFNEIPNENQEVDMEISNDEKESSDMDLAPSPQQLREIEEEEELALRSLVLTSIHKRKEELIKSPEKFSEDSSGNEQKMLTKSLKSVVQRLKQKKAQPIAIPARSGTKTIAMILAEQKGKKKRNLKAKEDLTELPKTNDIHAENFLIRTVVNDFVHPQEIPVQRCSEIVNSKPVLAVTNEIQPEDVSNIFTRPELPIQSVLLPMHEVQPPNSQDSSFSTITDTKNIPLLNTSSTDGAKKSRLVTSLEYVIKPVPRLIIPVRSDDTDTEEERSSPTKKTPRRIVKPPAKSKPAAQPEFEKNLENFLKNIRKEQEKKNVIQAAKPELSSVKHLPKSQQVEYIHYWVNILIFTTNWILLKIEYQQLMQKLKVLEEAKEKALKARQLKRTKSISEQSKLPLAPVKLASPKKQVTLTQTTKTTNKIEESLSKIPLLDKTAQQRFIEKTEINLKNHRLVWKDNVRKSENLRKNSVQIVLLSPKFSRNTIFFFFPSEKLFAATEQNLKLLAANEVDQNKQELITMQILELEKRLKRSKTSLGIINQRLKVNVHKVVQSSREMMKIHLHQ